MIVRFQTDLIEFIVNFVKVKLFLQHKRLRGTTNAARELQVVDLRSRLQCSSETFADFNNFDQRQAVEMIPLLQKPALVGQCKMNK